MIHDVFAQNFLIFSQEALSNYKVETASDFLDLHDQVRINIALGEASNHLVLTDCARVQLSCLYVHAANVLTLSQSTLPRVINVEASSYLVLAQVAKHEDKWPLVEQSLTLTDEATCVIAHGAYDTLVLTDEASYTIVKIVQASSGLVMVSAARAYKPDKMFIADPTLVVNAP
jgi:hypothetical protein